MDAPLLGESKMHGKPRAWRRAQSPLRLVALLLATATAMLVVGQLVGRPRLPDDSLRHDAASLRVREFEVGHGGLFQWSAGTKSHDDGADDAEIAADPIVGRQERAVFVVADAEDVQDFAKIICGLAASDQLVEVVSVAGSAPLQALSDLPCSITGSFTAVEAAFGSLVTRATVLFAIEDLIGLHHALVSAGAIDIHSRFPSDDIATLITLPRNELYALDWIGTMPIDALQSA